MNTLTQMDPARHKLGSVCKLGHTWCGTGRCLRYRHNGVCVMCKRANHAARMLDPEHAAKVRGQNRRADLKRLGKPGGRKAASRRSIMTRAKRRAEDPKAALVDRLRSRLRRAFKRYAEGGKAGTSREYGIDYAAIITHLGPCPGNPREYHVDHIRPLALFDLDDPAQVRAAFAPGNHQWLRAADNLRKSDTYVDGVSAALLDAIKTTDIK